MVYRLTCFVYFCHRNLIVHWSLLCNDSSHLFIQALNINKPPVKEFMNIGSHCLQQLWKRSGLVEPVHSHFDHTSTSGVLGPFNVS